MTQAGLGKWYTPYAILAQVRPARYLSFPTLHTLKVTAFCMLVIWDHL